MVRKHLENNLEAIVYSIAMLALFSLSLNLVQAYSYAGYKWSSYPVPVDVSAWPSGWITPLANSMSTWNAQSSPFAFNSGSSGHQFKTANNGTGNPIALTLCNVSGSAVTGCDTTFNTSFAWSTSGAAGAYDVQNTATHELGHWLILNDLWGGGNTEKTMYGTAATGETKKRTLDADDINGINAVYP